MSDLFRKPKVEVQPPPDPRLASLEAAREQRRAAQAAQRATIRRSALGSSALKLPGIFRA